jgi:hypothetical protein
MTGTGRLHRLKPLDEQPLYFDTHRLQKNLIKPIVLGHFSRKPASSRRIHENKTRQKKEDHA